MRIVKAIVPAAGLSTRYGAANKLLADWHGKPIVRWTVEALVSCDLEVMVVSGHQSDLIVAAVSPGAGEAEAGDWGARVKVAHNPDFAKGLGASIAWGVRAAGTADGYLIALGDMPGIRPEVIEKMLGAFETAPPDSILAPVYSAEPDRLGHPILFGAAHRTRLLGLAGDEGARSIIGDHLSRVMPIPVEGVLADIDEPST
ncbi:MAG: Molybdenum cofactor cytidylyltransferase [Fimbriimonadaceae bacterium]|nr:Molybdenum cofactor cytidylyltransferase [Fimbriimonadaceae bacterium]